jgi:O-antigen/teichoic acid export membrane protein
MASLETTPLMREKSEAVSTLPVVGTSEGWKPSAILTDIATLGTGTLVAAMINAVLVFVVPKLVSVEDYGYWRMFGLYASYVGFLHFGFADGALLRWAGRPLEEFHDEIGPSLRYLLLQHAVVLMTLCTFAWFMLSGPLRFVALAVSAFAVVCNLATVLQLALQSAKLFRPVAISTVAAPALFLGCVLVWRFRWTSSHQEITSFYIAGWLVVLLFLLAWTKPWSSVRSDVRILPLAKKCILNGWPIVFANTGVMLIAFADRLAVSWAASIQNFAQYSLAASAMAVPITAIQACSKVFFSHLAGVTPDGRKRIYGFSSRMVLIAWAILLPYYFALDVFIRHFLPRYAPSLNYARVLMLGIPFLAVIQILQMSYAYLNGMQKRFLVRTAGVLAISIGVTSFTAFRAGSLEIVAAVQVAVLGVWWLFNEWTLRDLTGDTLEDRLKFLAIYALVSGSFWLVTAPTGFLGQLAIVIYYACLMVVLVTFCRLDLRECSALLSHQDLPTVGSSRRKTP